MRNIFIILMFLFSSSLFAQWGQDLDTTIAGVRFVAKYDTTKFETKLTITKDKNKIHESIFLDNIFDISLEQFQPGGNKYYLLQLYSGGAHCCSSLLITEIKDNKFVVLDSGFYGNSGYVVEDINKDGIKEIMSGYDMFAYAFTNYSETRFPLRVQKFENGKLIEITGNFKDDLIMEIGYFEEDLNEILKTGFECPETDDEDTFNTDAGSVKTILAAIVADYYSLGQVERGYDLVKKVYKCKDIDKYIKILKEDFKLK
ncbi:MAG: hypothetical protein ACOYN6_09010 [Ignavibacteria bacterium]